MSTEESSTKSAEPTRKSILELSNDDARRFFLKSESYCSSPDLPPYIAFGNLLIEVEQIINGKQLCDLRNCTPRDYDDINYTILNNKDGKYAWRPFQLIHPVLYVSLVHQITEARNWTLI